MSARAVESFGWTVVRGHAYDEAAGHGFIDSQRKGLDVFATLPPDAPLLVVEAVWQYSHHVLAGLRTHRGPIMVVANWNGTFPGLVGPAQPDGQPDQGRCRVLVAVECRLHRRVGARRAAYVAGHGPAGPRPISHVHALPALDGDASPRSPSVGRWPTSCGGRRRSSGCSTRGAWGCTTRSSTTSC